MEDLDSVLDAALKAYVEQPAPPGLQHRILKRLRRPNPWLVLLPAAAVFIAVIMLPKPISVPPAPPLRLPEVAKVAKVTVPVPQPQHRRDPKASGPTPQQRALAAFVRQYPDQALAMITHEEITPLEVAPLNVPELKIEDLKITEDNTK